MNVFADPGQVADRFNEALARVTRMWTREANPLDARNVVDMLEQTGEVALGIIRVYGTTQNAQWSLQPSMIVTYAFTGSCRCVIPSGNVTSSSGAISTAGNVDAAACSTSIGSIFKR